jgi:hypothetical protein
MDLVVVEEGQRVVTYNNLTAVPARRGQLMGAIVVRGEMNSNSTGLEVGRD